MSKSNLHTKTYILSNNFTLQIDSTGPPHSIQSKSAAIPDIEVGQVFEESGQDTQGFIRDVAVIDGESLQCTVGVTDVQDPVVCDFTTKLSTETQLSQGLFPKEIFRFNTEEGEQYPYPYLPKTSQSHIGHIGIPQIKFLDGFEAEFQSQCCIGKTFSNPETSSYIQVF